jgi:hypothetical protein
VTSDAEMLASALLAAQRDGDTAGMRLMADHAGAELREAACDLILAELVDRALADVAEGERLALLLGRASVYSRLDLSDPMRRHQVAHPFRPVDDALRWELGDRAARHLVNVRVDADTDVA